MNLCLNAFVIQFPNGLLDTCSVTAPRALLLPYTHRGHCKDEDSYKEVLVSCRVLHKPNETKLSRGSGGAQVAGRESALATLNIKRTTPSEPLAAAPGQTAPRRCDAGIAKANVSRKNPNNQKIVRTT